MDEESFHAFYEQTARSLRAYLRSMLMDQNIVDDLLQESYFRLLKAALPDAMEEAADYVAPTCPELERLAVPMGIAAAVDDAVHPVEVAVEWMTAAPHQRHIVRAAPGLWDVGGAANFGCWE